MIQDRPRIAYLVSRYPAVSHTFILREVRALRSMGFPIQVVSINAPDRDLGQMTAVEKEEASATFYVKTSGPQVLASMIFTALVSNPVRCLVTAIHAMRLGGTDLRRIVYGLFYWAEALVIAEWMRKHELRHLHVHFATPAATVGMLVKRLIGVSLSLTVHGPDEFYDVTLHNLREKVEEADFIFAISNFARSQLMKYSSPTCWPKIEVCRLGVDPEMFAPSLREGSDKSFEILCVGRLVPAKGQHILLEAASLVASRIPGLKVRFVGDGPQRALLESEAKKPGLAPCIVFEGPVNQDRILDFYRNADVFVLPSFAEGIPVVLMEAMAMEIPCVTTPVAGIPELIQAAVDGILVPPSDSERLAETLMMIHKDPKLKAELGRMGRKKILLNYNLPHNTARMAEVFDRRLRFLYGVPERQPELSMRSTLEVQQ